MQDIKDIRTELKLLISSQDIQARISELAKQISNDFKNKPVTLIICLRGAIFFAVDLAKRLDIIFDMEFIQMSNYGNNRESGQNIVIKKDLEKLNCEKNFIIVEDIIDTGHSLDFLVRHLKKFNPISISTCVLLDKPERREIDINPDYYGFTVPNKFIVGYGLDYNNHFRNIDYIGYLDD